jgi:outer membrane protein
MRNPAVLVLALLLLPSAAVAQSVPARLTLEEALALARAHNPSLRRVVNEIEAAEANTRQQYGALLPRLNTSIGFGLGRSTALTGQDPFGRPVRLDDPIDYRSSTASQSIGAQMTVFDGGRNVRNIATARAQERVADARVAAEARRVDALVARQFYQALRADVLIELEQRLLASAAANLERTEELLRIAGASHPDVLGARLQLAAAEQDVARAESEARKAKLQLLELLGVAGAPEFELAGELPEPVDPASLDGERLVADALAASPATVQAHAATRAASQRTSAARAARWPTITASAGFGRSMSLSSYDAFFELNPQNRGLNFQLGAALPLFTGFQTSAAVTQAAVAERNAREDERAAGLAVGREVRSALIDLEQAYNTFELSMLRASLSRERLAMAEEQYRLGSLNFILLQQHIDQAAQAERGALDARFGYAAALVALEERAATRIGF